MHPSTVLSVAILLIPNIVNAHDGHHPHQLVERATLNGPCTGAGGAPGVCIPTADCTSKGGTHIQYACSGLPADVRCCTKTSCGSGGNCRFSNTCASGNTLTGLCPGPTEFKCCLPGSSGGGTSFPPPRIPPVGSCKSTAVSAAQKTVAALPGKVREIFCIRDCACPGSSDHCCGLANDFMCTSAGGVRNDAGTANGLAIRNWVQANAAALKVKYIIWGQQIWSPARASEGWRNMEDRGSITQNHWDHVHVSYNG